MKIERFEDLDIWKESLSLTKLIYDISAKKEFGKDYGLKDQIRRSVVSISSNIVEGFEKNNNNEFIRYLKIAKGSAGECRNQLNIALLVEHINKSEFNEIDKKLEALSRQIGGFINYLQNKRSNGEFTRK